MTDRSEVTEFYSGKKIFLTGGTGFLGICLIEKLIRCVPDIGTIYMLMRPKKGKDIQDRLQEVIKNPIFENSLETKSGEEIMKKLHAVSGDIGEDGLGLSPEDRDLLRREVNVVVHSAASLDFGQNLRTTVNINLLGTRKVLELCKEIKNLQVMIHISSAYANSFRFFCEEVMYPTLEDVEKVIGLATTLSDDALEELEPQLLKEHPNTYTFTKHFAEHEVAKCAGLFPCTIIRPSMILGAWKEPIPGWTASKNGPHGFLMGATIGVMRRVPANVHLINDFIPIDIVVNEILITGYLAAKDKGPLAIYHCTSSTCRPFTWAAIESRVNIFLRKYPLKGAIWYPTLKFMPSIWRFKLSSFFVHFIPGYILDTVARLSGQKPRLVRMHKNINASVTRLEKFIFNEWMFDNTRTLELADRLSDVDKVKYQMDISTLQWDAFYTNLMIGVRTYLNKESFDTLEQGKRKFNVFFVLHILLQCLIYLLIWYTFSSCLGITMRQSAWILPISYFLISMI